MTRRTRLLVALAVVLLGGLGVGAFSMLSRLDIVSALLSGDAGAPGTLLLRMERSACFGWCPDYVVEIDTDGSVRYRGYDYVLMRGDAEGRITPGAVADLHKALEQADFAGLPSDCCHCVDMTDAPSVVLTVGDGLFSKTINDYHGCLATPKSMRDLENEIDRIVDIEKWIGTEEQIQACLFSGRPCPSMHDRFSKIGRIAASNFSPAGTLMLDSSSLSGAGTAVLVNLDDTAGRPRRSMAAEVSANCTTGEAHFRWRRTFSGWNESGMLEAIEPPIVSIAPGAARDAILRVVCAK